MKNIIIWTLCALFYLTIHVHAQFIVASLPQVNYPIPGVAQTYEPDHMGSYHFHHSDGGNNGQFAVYSWSNPFAGPNNAGFAYIFVDNTFSTIYDNGFQNINDALEVEVATMTISGQKYIVVSYHNASGAYVDFYHYIFPGILNPSGSFLLSPTGKKTRMDAHKEYAVAITYEDASGINVATIESGTFPMINTEVIPGTIGGTIPDVAFSHDHTGLMVRFVYYMPGTIYVQSKDFYQIGNPSIPFSVDDMNPFVQTSYIDIDCPDHAMGPDYKWAYTYDMGNKLFVRSFVNGIASSPYLFAVNDPFLMSNYNNFKPSIAYEANQDVINVGWATRNFTGLFNKNVAVRYRFDGAPLTTPGSYLLLSNGPVTTNYGKHNVVSLSKNTEIPYIFTAFSMLGPGSPMNEDIIVKVRPIGIPTFKGVGANALVTSNIQAIPNPFQENFILDASTIDGNEILQVNIVDITGRTVLHTQGTIDVLNASILTASKSWTAGMYSIQLKGSTVEQHIKVIKQY